MRRYILLWAALFSTPCWAALAQNQPDSGDDTGLKCRETADKIIAATGAVTSHTEGLNIFLKHPNVKQLSIDCAFGFSIGASWDTNYPPDEFFDIFSTAASQTGIASKSQIEKAAHECQQATRKERISYVDIGSSQVSCGISINLGAYLSFFPN